MKSGYITHRAQNMIYRSYTAIYNFLTLTNWRLIAMFVPDAILLYLRWASKKNPSRPPGDHSFFVLSNMQMQILP